jgi:MFS family permease
MKRVLAVIVISQFFCTSLWFAGNAVLPDIISHLGISTDLLARITSVVQLGFISGTLLFAVLAISDRFQPVMVFFICSVLASLCNLTILIGNMTVTAVLISRFLTGFFLAGIYPVGMKIAADHYKDGLGKSLGLLVGALVLGTALPHLLRTISFSVQWQYVIMATSLLSIAGGWLMYQMVAEGPYRKQGQPLRLSAFSILFRQPGLRAAVSGYFGHMWELYAFWAFVPVILKNYQQLYPGTDFSISLSAFFIIAAGSAGCMIAGYLSQSYPAKKIALYALCLSGSCCLLSPFFTGQASFIVLLLFMIVWGISVIADSPLFSTLVAQQSPPGIRGSVITLVTCIGFAITIISIQLLNYIIQLTDSRCVYLILAIGPVGGIIALLRKKKITDLPQ